MFQLVTTKEAISLLGCSPSTFKRYLRKGNLSTTKKIDGKSYFDKERILNFSPPNPLIKNRPNFNQRSSSGLGKTALLDIIEKWRVNSRDNSSADVQIGIYTEKIRKIELELKRISANDPIFKRMRYTLLKQVGERRKLLHYLEISNYGRYRRARNLVKKEHQAA
jgi:ribosomal protein S15